MVILGLQRNRGPFSVHWGPDAGGDTELSCCDFFYDFSSPFTYLAATQIERICQGHDLRWRPFLLGALFKEVGTPIVPIATFCPAKAKLALADQYRWAEHWGVDFKFPSMFPQRTVKALRVAVQLPADVVAAVSLDLFDLMWVKDGDLNDDERLKQILNGHGLDADSLVANTQSPDVKAKLKDNTDEAVRLGLCGAPSFVVNGIIFWGQDRLHFVEKALAGWVPKEEAEHSSLLSRFLPDSP